MTVESGALPKAAPDAGVRRWRRWVRLGVVVAVLGPVLSVGVWHGAKPLPDGLRVASDWIEAPAGDARLLFDITAADGYGRPVVQQQIFDESLRMIAAAREFIVLDQFLFNAHHGSLGPETAADAGAAAAQTPVRSLSRELRDAVIAARRDQPQLRVLFITDPINDVYGGAPSPDLAALRAAGVDVVVTDLDRLRDPNPIYSTLWRVGIRWWSGDGAGLGWLPNPLAEGPERVTFRAWARLLNMKANHRKVLVADDGAGGLIGLVGSMNPHDASGAHSNTALQVRGAALTALLASELAVARFSGWRGDWPMPAVVATAAPAATAATTAPRAGPALRLRTLTEGAIRDALLEQIALAQRDDRIDLAMFYLSERRIIDALVAAAARGVTIRVLLDPNRDAFGREKNGIPNRPVASELVTRSDGAIKLRWYRTHGEQFHSKLFALHQADRSWLTTGSANLTRRNVADFNLEANLAVEAPPDTEIVRAATTWFDTLWTNRAPVGVEYSTDFGTFADPAQSSYWAYRIMEATGLSSF
jgi:phosphatidylserine/phosphatidylglycerophosphate/cardiolipin synthase-like enzyme